MLNVLTNTHGLDYMNVEYVCIDIWSEGFDLVTPNKVTPSSAQQGGGV